MTTVRACLESGYTYCNLCFYTTIILFIIIFWAEFRYSEKATKSWPIFHLQFDNVEIIFSK